MILEKRYIEDGFLKEANPSFIERQARFYLGNVSELDSSDLLDFTRSKVLSTGSGAGDYMRPRPMERRTPLSLRRKSLENYCKFSALTFFVFTTSVIHLIGGNPAISRHVRFLGSADWGIAVIRRGT